MVSFESADSDTLFKKHITSMKMHMQDIASRHRTKPQQEWLYHYRLGSIFKIYITRKSFRLCYWWSYTYYLFYYKYVVNVKIFVF